MTAKTTTKKPAAKSTSKKATTKPAEAEERMNVLVCGAHLEGQPLNHQLTDLAGTLVERTTTAPCYRLYALADGKRPALVRVAEPPAAGEGAAAIEVEVWALPVAAVGRFLAGIGPPLGLGNVQLADGSFVKGFICEAGNGLHCLGSPTDITHHKGWRAYKASQGV